VKDREPVPYDENDAPSVDVMVTVVGEPLHILKRTLVGCLAQHYPKDRFEVHVLDDGQRADVRALARELGCNYLARQERVHAKAGNLNDAMKHTRAELIAVFDVDHVPAPDFLAKTVGFFVEEKVAIVQTAHHFHNPDIFQRNLRLEGFLSNEQALFFRMLQSGRDHHNSAFFAGSGGVLRRTALEEIGGFQYDTITEDIHTSLLLHAKGWESRYLNAVLSSGLMPETFEGYVKQRSRWATGCAQVLVRDNPLWKRGLSLAQRIDYFGAVYYFFLGMPRVVYIVAPLAWLLFGLPALKANTVELMTFFFPYFLASAFTLRMVSRNTRNALWSDVYETAMCFALSKAVLKGIFTGRQERKFEVTPKGQRIEKSGIGKQRRLVYGHLAVFGLLAFGIVMGARQWFGPNPTPGLEISLFWAAFNMVLVGAAILSARERPQLRNFMRLTRDYPCEILHRGKRISAMTVDLNERGVAVRIDEPLYTDDRELGISISGVDGERIAVRGEIVRQEREGDGSATLGIRFTDLGDQAIQQLIERVFTGTEPEREEFTPIMDALHSFWKLLSSLGRVMQPAHPSHRRMPRIPFERTCELHLPEHDLGGITRDVSYTGLSVAFSEGIELPPTPRPLTIGDVELEVLPISSVQRDDTTVVRFGVEKIEQGERTWHAWHTASSSA
jgi:cellulose synthase (UDP-forming)